MDYCLSIGHKLGQLSSVHFSYVALYAPLRTTS